MRKTSKKITALLGATATLSSIAAVSTLPASAATLPEKGDIVCVTEWEKYIDSSIYDRLESRIVLEYSYVKEYRNSVNQSFCEQFFVDGYQGTRFVRDNTRYGEYPDETERITKAYGWADVNKGHDCLTPYGDEFAVAQELGCAELQARFTTEQLSD